MANTPTRNISLTVEFTADIHAQVAHAQVASSHYSNASQVVRAGLRLLIERDRAPAASAQPAARRGAAWFIV